MTSFFLVNRWRSTAGARCQLLRLSRYGSRSPTSASPILNSPRHAPPLVYRRVEPVCAVVFLAICHTGCSPTQNPTRRSPNRRNLPFRQLLQTLPNRSPLRLKNILRKEPWRHPLTTVFPP